jgi:hypothetical protein
MRILALTCLSIILGASAFSQSSKPTFAPGFAESMGPPDANPQYFPKGVFDPTPELADFCARWYAKHLRAMNAESLLKKAADKQARAYRFLWLPTFHHSISVLLTVRPDGSGQLSSVELSGKGGYEPGSMLATKIVELSKDQVNQFNAMSGIVDFWTAPTVDPQRQGDDGSEWILEGVKDQKYHVVTRWTPKDGPFRDACLYLLKESQIPLTVNIY